MVLDPADLADLAQLGEEESPRYVARRPFKLNGEKVKPGEPVDVSVIPRWESWIHTGFIALEKATA